MKIKKDIDNLIKENYIGSVVAFEDDIGRFFAVKRVLKKHLTKNILSDIDNIEKSKMNIVSLLNQLSLLRNVFRNDILMDVFEEILESEEYFVMLSIWHCAGNTKTSVNKEFENQIFAILRT